VSVLSRSFEPIDHEHVNGALSARNAQPCLLQRARDSWESQRLIIRVADAEIKF
jgi:hypothetical protein